MAKPSDFDSAGGTRGRSLGIAVLIVLLAVLAFLDYGNATAKPLTDALPGGDDPALSGHETPAPADVSGAPQPGDAPEQTAEPAPAQPVLYDFRPRAVDATQPSKYIGATNTVVNGEAVTGDYSPDFTIDFGQGADYSALPGVITSIEVNVGDEVKAGDTLLVLEAMKMANNIETEKDGKVTAILVKPGQTVMEDDPLVVVE